MMHWLTTTFRGACSSASACMARARWSSGGSTSSLSSRCSPPSSRSTALNPACKAWPICWRRSRPSWGTLRWLPTSRPLTLLYGSLTSPTMALRWIMNTTAKLLWSHTTWIGWSGGSSITRPPSQTRWMLLTSGMFLLSSTWTPSLCPSRRNAFWACRRSCARGLQPRSSRLSCASASAPTTKAPRSSERSTSTLCWRCRHKSCQSMVSRAAWKACMTCWTPSRLSPRTAKWQPISRLLIDLSGGPELQRMPRQCHRSERSRTGASASVTVGVAYVYACVRANACVPTRWLPAARAMFSLLMASLAPY
mmetsp:Transcript_49578/g.119330  ORF Transcript_49578/g.119330 Transcript_49578/m.119330 type:complete len:308 (-) Transcript_49578:151-1074(-)